MCVANQLCVCSESTRVTAKQLAAKRLCSETTLNQTAISIPQSVVFTELKAVVLTEERASHKGGIFVKETEATTCDYRGALGLWSMNGYALSEV